MISARSGALNSSLRQAVRTAAPGDVPALAPQLDLGEARNSSRRAR
jgi:hypothetical protein